MVGEARVRLAVTVASMSLLIGCAPLPGDPAYYLFADNSTSSPLIARLVYEGNMADGISDPEYRLAALQTTWLVTMRSGYGPDAIEILDIECHVLGRLEAAKDLAGRLVVVPGVGETRTEDSS
jgi:hypothetical protein